MAGGSVDPARRRPRRFMSAPARPGLPGCAGEWSKVVAKWMARHAAPPEAGSFIVGCGGALWTAGKQGLPVSGGVCLPSRQEVMTEPDCHPYDRSLEVAATPHLVLLLAPGVSSAYSRVFSRTYHSGFEPVFGHGHVFASLLTRSREG